MNAIRDDGPLRVECNVNEAASAILRVAIKLGMMSADEVGRPPSGFTIQRGQNGKLTTLTVLVPGRE